MNLCAVIGWFLELEQLYLGCSTTHLPHHNMDDTGWMMLDSSDTRSDASSSDDDDESSFDDTWGSDESPFDGTLDTSKDTSDDDMSASADPESGLSQASISEAIRAVKSNGEWHSMRANNITGKDYVHAGNLYACHIELNEMRSLEDYQEFISKGKLCQGAHADLRRIAHAALHNYAKEAAMIVAEGIRAMRETEEGDIEAHDAQVCPWLKSRGFQNMTEEYLETGLCVPWHAIAPGAVKELAALKFANDSEWEAVLKMECLLLKSFVHSVRTERTSR